MKTLIIAFTGEARAGKSYCSEQIKGTTLHFATPFKAIATKSFGWNGVKDEKGRRLLQVIGTEAGRDYNPDIWVEIMDDKIFKLIQRKYPPKIILVDDLRFENEAKLIHEYGGYIIKLEKERTPKEKLERWIKSLFTKTLNHRSEKGISRKYINYTIRARHGELGRIQEQLDKILAEIKEKNK